MPIRAENRHRYPPDWKAIRAAILERAGNRCERCGVRNGARIRRGTFQRRPVWSEAASAHCDVFCADTGERLVGEGHDTCDLGRPICVVLTIAHLDHTPENCDPANLRAWCQRCHNAYDAAMRASGIRARCRAAAAVGDLFDGARLRP